MSLQSIILKSITLQGVISKLRSKHFRGPVIIQIFPPSELSEQRQVLAIHGLSRCAVDVLGHCLWIKHLAEPPGLVFSLARSVQWCLLTKLAIACCQISPCGLRPPL